MSISTGVRGVWIAGRNALWLEEAEDDPDGLAPKSVENFDSRPMARFLSYCLANAA
jgi:hypothetical protein